MLPRYCRFSFTADSAFLFFEIAFRAFADIFAFSFILLLPFHYFFFFAFSSLISPSRFAFIELHYADIVASMATFFFTPAAMPAFFKRRSCLSDAAAALSSFAACASFCPPPYRLSPDAARRHHPPHFLRFALFQRDSLLPALFFDHYFSLTLSMLFADIFVSLISHRCQPAE